MDELKIQDPEDWYKVQRTLRKMLKGFPQFVFDYNKIHNNIELKIKDLCLIDIEMKHRPNSIYHKQLRKNKVDEINEILRTFSKILLIANLAKR